MVEELFMQKQQCMQRPWVKNKLNALKVQKESQCS